LLTLLLLHHKLRLRLLLLQLLPLLMLGSLFFARAPDWLHGNGRQSMALTREPYCQP
jgi:hypothetical protein